MDPQRIIGDIWGICLFGLLLSSTCMLLSRQGSHGDKMGPKQQEQSTREIYLDTMANPGREFVTGTAFPASGLSPFPLEILNAERFAAVRC